MKEYFENCQANGVSGERGFSKLNSIKNSSANAYGFEKSRENNKETMEQLEIIDNSVTSVIDRYKSNLWENTECKPREDNKQLVGTGCLTTGYCKGKWLVLSSGLDIAISTEELKVRGK